LLFPISGIEAESFSFRFFRIKDALPADNTLPVRMQRWADRLWRVELKCPVYPAQQGGARGFLVPSEALARAGAPRMITLTDVPDREYTLEVTDEIRTIAIHQASPAERDLICRILERPFTDLLVEKRSQLWKAEWTLFFPLTPANCTVAEDVMNAYRGFKFAVVLMDSVPYLATDIRTRYIGRKALADYTLEERDRILCDHLDLSLREDRRSSFLRDNGPTKIPCRYTGETRKTVAEFEFEPGKTVASYYAARYRLDLNPYDPVVFARDRSGAQAAKPVPASRLFPVFTTDFEGVRYCSVKPWMSPEERYDTAKHFLQHFSGAKLGTRVLTVRDEILTKARTVFQPPRLEFGSGRVLEPFQGRPPAPDDEAFDRQIVRWASSKYPTLLDAGPQHNEPMPDLVLLYPDRLARDVRETFVRDVSKEILLQTSQQIHLVQQLQYSSGRKEKMGGALLRRVPEVRSLAKRCLALVVLCDDFDSSVHGDLKDQMRPVHSQCVTENTVYNIAKRRDPNRAKSQVRNLALAILTEVGVKPWVLAEPLHYDAYIGIDLLYGRVAYHAFCGTGGRVITSSCGESRLRGRMQEGIKAPLLRAKMDELVREMSGAGHRIGSLIIHRDGRWWPSEAKGFRAAVARLQGDHALPGDLKWAVVEIRKNHMPVRLFTVVDDARSRLLQNPLPGSYLVLDDRRVLLTTTGRPGKWDAQGRTAGTLLLQVADKCGDISLECLAEDAYRLTHLNWTSPDIEISLPVTIRWADEALRETVTRAADGADEDPDEHQAEEDAEEGLGASAGE
jgi:hypothetical protein